MITKRNYEVVAKEEIKAKLESDRKEEKEGSRQYVYIERTFFLNDRENC